MKKALSLLLALVLCLSMCACAGSTDKSSAFVGKWNTEDSKVSLIVNKDKTGELTYYGETVAFSWIYDENSSMMVVTPDDESYNILSFTYLEESDSLYNTWYMFERAN